MNVLRKAIQNRNKQESVYEERMLALLTRLEETVQQAEKTTRELKENKVQSSLNPAKEVARQVAESQISEFRSLVGDSLEKIIDDTEKEKKQMLSDTRKDMQNMANNFSKELNDVMKTVRDTAQAQLTAYNQKFAQKEVEIENTRKDLKQKLLSLFDNFKNKLEQMRGPKGEDGAKGKDGKDGSPDTPKQIAQKLNTTTNSVEMKVIKGLDEKISGIRSIARAKSGGGMGNVVFKTFTGNGSTTTFSLDYAPANSGKALIFIYQGQVLENETHFTISGKTITTTFTPDNGTTLFAWSIR